jgi:hypothetical protein
VAIGEALADPALGLKEDWADPSFIQVGNTFYPYATASAGKHVQIASSLTFWGPWKVLPQDGLQITPLRLGLYLMEQIPVEKDLSFTPRTQLEL